MGRNLTLAFLAAAIVHGGQQVEAASLAKAAQALRGVPKRTTGISRHSPLRALIDSAGPDFTEVPGSAGRETLKVAGKATESTARRSEATESQADTEPAGKPAGGRFEAVGVEPAQTSVSFFAACGLIAAALPLIAITRARAAKSAE